MPIEYRFDDLDLREELARADGFPEFVPNSDDTLCPSEGCYTAAYGNCLP
jgi:hypothetical protein